MNKLIATETGGIPDVWDDLEFFLGQNAFADAGIYQAMQAYLSKFGTDFIISGCEVSGSSIAEGWIFLAGEILKVDAHTKTNDYYQKVTTYHPLGDVQTQTGNPVQKYQMNRGVCSASSGLLYNGPRMKRDQIVTISAAGVTTVANNVCYIVLNPAGSGVYSINLPNVPVGEKIRMYISSSSHTGSIAVFGQDSVQYYSLNPSGAIYQVVDFTFVGSAWQVIPVGLFATNEVRGLIETATLAEIQGGTIETAAITPLSLAQDRAVFAEQEDLVLNTGWSLFSVGMKAYVALLPKNMAVVKATLALSGSATYIVTTAMSAKYRPQSDRFCICFIDGSGDPVFGIVSSNGIITIGQFSRLAPGNKVNINIVYSLTD